jgi:hypothetical protein
VADLIEGVKENDDVRDVVARMLQSTSKKAMQPVKAAWLFIETGRREAPAQAIT